ALRLGPVRRRRPPPPQLALQSTEVPAPPLRRGVGQGEHEAVDCRREAVDHSEVVLVPQHADQGAARVRWIELSQRVGEDSGAVGVRSEEHTSELQSLRHLVCRLLLEKKKLLFYGQPYETAQIHENMAKYSKAKSY